MPGDSGIVVDDLAFGETTSGYITLSRLERLTFRPATRTVECFATLIFSVQFHQYGDLGLGKIKLAKGFITSFRTKHGNEESPREQIVSSRAYASRICANDAWASPPLISGMICSSSAITRLSVTE